MYNLRKVFLLFFLASSILFSQQEVSFSQFMFLPQLFNPSVVGIEEKTILNLIDKSQWIGFEGAPSSNAASINGKLNQKGLGWGFSFLYDRIGPLVNTTASIETAYHLKINKKENHISIGLKLTGENYYLDNNSLIQLDPGDTAFDPSNYGDIVPNFGFGIQYRSPNFFLNAAIPRLIESNRYETARHIYVGIGGRINISKLYSLRPNLLLKHSKNTPLGYDFNLLFDFVKGFWIGPLFRGGIESSFDSSSFTSARGLIGGFQLTTNWKFSYAYSVLPKNLIYQYNSGTHEFFVGYSFRTKSEKKEKINK